MNFEGQEAGFFGLTPFMKKTTSLNYCFYRDFWGGKSLKISKWIINDILKRKNEYGEHLIDVILGITPANNKMAINFLKKNGMTILGKIPGIIDDHRQQKTVAGVFSYISRHKNGKAHRARANLMHLFS